MSQDNRPREFWLPLTTLVVNSDPNRPNGVHVVEMSAYQSVCERLKQVEGERNKLKSKLLDSIKDYDDCIKDRARIYNESVRRGQERDQFRADLEICIEALEFYAKPLDHEWDQNHKELWADNEYRKFGARAREVLATLRERHKNLNQGETK